MIIELENNMRTKKRKAKSYKSPMSTLKKWTTNPIKLQEKLFEYIISNNPLCTYSLKALLILIIQWEVSIRGKKED